MLYKIDSIATLREEDTDPSRLLCAQLLPLSLKTKKEERSLYFFNILNISTLIALLISILGFT